MNIKKMDVNPNHVDTPTQMLSAPFYFASPLTTLLESLHDPDCTKVTLHDIMEAYDCFSDRICLVAKTLMLAEVTPKALRIIEEHSSRLVEVLKRDLQRPFLCPAIQSQNSFDLYSFGSPTLADDDAQYVLDSAKLAQHALCMISDICAFRPLYSLFSAHDFQSLMDDVFAYSVPSRSPVLNESKLCTFIVWILQTQQLPAEALLHRKDIVSLTISRAIQGHFGPQAIVDGLKAIHSLLGRHGRLFISSIVALLSNVLDYAVNDSLDVRSASIYAISGFASARKHFDVHKTGRSVRRAVNAFIEDQHKKRKDAQNRLSLGGFIEDSISSTKSSQSCASPCWALTLISSLIVIFDYTVFFYPHCVKLIFSTLFHIGNHKRSAVRALHPHVWKLLIWAYLRIPTTVDKEEFGNVDIVDIKERSFKVVAQDIRNDIGIALVSSLLQCDRTFDGVYSEQVENALALVQDMMCSSNDGVRRNASMLFRRLYGLTEEDNSPLHPKELLLCEQLFDGSLLSFNLTALGDLVRSIPSSTLENTRQLANEEIYNHWRSVVSLWVTAAKLSLQEPDSQLLADVLSAWTSLLEIFVQRCDCLTPTSSPTGLSSSVVMLVGQLLDVPNVPEVQARHLEFVKSVWLITKNVLYDTWLPSNAEIILAAVLKRNFVLNDRVVLQAWSDLCAELISVGVPTLLHVVYFQSEKWEQVEVLRQLWTILARTWQVIDHATTWDDLVTLLVIPFGAWKLSTPMFEQWESILRNAVRLADHSSASGNAVIALLLERLGNSRAEAFKADPRALYSILRHVDIASYKKHDLKFFEFVDNALSDLYSPMPESLATCIDLLCVLGELITTCPDGLLLGFVKTVQRSMSLWIQDENSTLLDTEQNIVVNALYCNTLERLSHHEPTFEMLDSLAPFLVSVFKVKRIPGPALGPFSFISFWRKTYHGKDFNKLYPDDIKTCLMGVSLVWGGNITSELISDSQKSVSIVPDSQATPRNRNSPEQVHTPFSSPFRGIVSSLRRSSAPPSLLQFASPASNVCSQRHAMPERRLENSSSRTPPGRQLVSVAGIQSKLPNSRTVPIGPMFLKGKKRKLGDDENRASKRLGGIDLSRSSPPQFISSTVQKSPSEPSATAKHVSAIAVEERSNSLPISLKKRKLFDYTDLTRPRDVRRRTSQEKRVPRSWNEVGKEQKVPPIATFALQEIEHTLKDVDGPRILSEPSKSLLSPEPQNAAEPRNRSQSLPISERVEGSLASVQRRAVQRNQSAWARLEETYAALQETSGASQVPVQELVRAAKLASQMKAKLDEMVNRHIAKTPPKTD